jgi:hypothetical protein
MRATACMVLVVGLFAGVLLADDHGDSPLTATPIEVGGDLLTACIEVPEDMDYFLFAGVAGRSYRIRITHQSDEMASVLYLFASDGRTILAVAHDSDDSTGAQIAWTCPSDGTFFVMARHAQSATGTGCYGLALSLEVLDDHGDDPLSATPLTVNREATPGFLETSADVDAFLFSVVRGYDYVVTLTRTSSRGRLTLEVFDDTDAGQLVDVEGVASLDIRGEEDGSLFIRVGAPADSGAVGYEIRVSRTGYADDFGNDASSAHALDAHGPVVSGSIEVPIDSDWFSFDAREGGEYGFTLSASPGLSCRLALYAADGQLVLQQVSATSGGMATIEWSAPDATRYFLEVESVDGSGTYALSVASALHLEAIGGFNPSGYSLDVWAEGTLVYLIVGVKGLSIIDVSNPTDPHELGSHSTRGYAEAIALAGTFALIANRGDGVTVIDVSDPSRPAEVGVLETPGWAQDVAVVGSLAVVADQRAGIHVARIGSTGAIELLASYETRGHAGAVAIDGDIAYVAIGDAGLEMVDLADPLSPVYLGTVEIAGDARDVVVRDTIAYVASGYRGVRIIDISDPALAEQVGWFGTSDEAVGLHLSASHLFVAERTGVSVYSLSDPLAPERVAQIDTPGEAIAVFVSDGLVFVADRQEGLLIARLLP